VQVKDWLHPADTVRITELPEEEIQRYTDGSKNDNGVGAGIAIFIKGKLEQQLKYKLHNNCSNNLDEQMVILKAIEAIENIYKDSRRTATIYTDSRVTIQSLKNHRNHTNLIEEIRNKAIVLERQEWPMKFTWIKAHVGNHGNEIADNLAKGATKNKEIIYNKIPKSQIAQVKQQSIEKWQTQWKKQQKGLQQNSFSQNKGKIKKKKTQVNTKLHSNSNSPRENQRLLAQI
jgi:ribonuclease HI